MLRSLPVGVTDLKYGIKPCPHAPNGKVLPYNISP